MGQPTTHNDPFSLNSRLEQAYFDLRVQKLDLEAKMAKLEKDNLINVQTYEALSTECQRLKEENNAKLPQEVNLDYELIQKINEENVIKNEELRNYIVRLEKDIDGYQKRVKEQDSKNKDKTNEVVFDLLFDAIGELEKLTKSQLSKEPMLEPVLTPSNHIIDRTEVVKLSKDSKDHWLLINAPYSKERIFFPMMSLIDFKDRLKIRIEQIINDSG